jgi:glycosyltransferase involved in cell wall biosynthesis
MKLTIVIPVLDDWPAVMTLISEIAVQFVPKEVELRICLVDDGSVERFDLAEIHLPAKSCITRLEVVQLALNLGHQRAIAVGLCLHVRDNEVDAVVLMDGDGEDRPQDLRRLVSANQAAPTKIVVVQRGERSETQAFKIGYVAYRLLFGLLVGRRMRFGNFSLLPLAAARRLVHMPELWNNIPASIMRSRIPYDAIDAPRGKRYAGKSRMVFASLIAHGLSAMSVYTDIIAARILMGSAIVGALALAGMVVVGFIRFVTDLAIPGWASTVVGDLLVILMQTLVIVVATSLGMLSSRGLRPMIPIVDSAAYVVDRRFRNFGEPRE